MRPVVCRRWNIPILKWSWCKDNSVFGLKSALVRKKHKTSQKNRFFAISYLTFPIVGVDLQNKRGRVLRELLVFPAEVFSHKNPRRLPAGKGESAEN